jgi:hypothetical protein
MIRVAISVINDSGALPSALGAARILVNLD